MYPEALGIYKTILSKADSSALDTQLSSYDKVHEICKKMGRFEAAYEYVLAHNEVKVKIEDDKKRQQTAYLKIKFDSEQKEKDNAILAAEIVKEQTQNKFLHTIVALISISLLILVGAFFQKKRYNNKLRKEVLKRTLNLRKSNAQLSKTNKELDEFNRILSHDLKEPLRSIVGFSKLASKVSNNPSKTNEYLGFVQ